MISASYSITGGDFASAGYASRGLKERLRRIGVEAEVMRRVMIAAYEAEMNVVIHARRGNLWARLDSSRVDLEIVDEGPGIPDVERALTPGFSTASAEARALGFGAGMGLPNIRRASDEFELSTEAGKGTRLRATIFLKAQATGNGSTHSVSLRPEACTACLACLKACPTGAIRLAAGRPLILEHLCVDCTACIAACPRQVFGVRRAEAGAGAETAEGPGAETGKGPGAETTGAGPAAAGQATLVLPRAFLTHFGAEATPAAVLGCLRSMGYAQVRFTEEWEDALRGELARTAAGTAGSAAGDAPRGAARGVASAAPETAASALPVISPVCPAVVKLIETHFPALIPHLAPFLSPVEAAQEALAFGPAPLGSLDFVVACPSQASCLEPYARSGRLAVTSTAELAARALAALRAGKPSRQAAAPAAAASPASAAAAAAPASPVEAPEPPARQPAPPDMPAGRTLRVSGLPSVLRVLEQAEKGLLADFPLIEPLACPGGCFGSPLFASDPFVAGARFARFAAGLPEPPAPRPAALPRRRGYLPRSGERLDRDMARAIAKLSRVDALTRALPGRDCAACGAPSCGHLAEDVVLERAKIEACPFRDPAGSGPGSAAVKEVVS